MKKNKLLLTLGSIAISLSVGTLLASCKDGQDSNDLSSQQDSTVSVALEIVSQPTKTSYKVGEALDLAGLVIKKVTTAGGVSDGGVTMSNSDLSFSTPDGTVLNTAGTLTITVSDPNDSDVADVSFNVAVADKETYTVTFENYDETTLDTETTKEGGTVSYGGETPKRASDENYGYTFAGWYIKGDSSETVVDVDTYVPEGNVTFVAKFVAWDASSGDGTLNYMYSDSYGENGGYYVTGFDTDAEDKTILNVPETFKEKPVVGIADSAFESVKTLTKVILGTKLEYIGAKAFYTDSAIKGVSSTLDDYEEGTLKVPASVKTLSEKSFRGLTSITKIDVGSENLTVIPKEAFYGCTKAATLILNEGVTTLGVDAFCNLAATSVTLPDSLTELGYALSNSSGIGTEKKPNNTPFTSAKIIKIKLGNGLTPEAIEESGLNFKLTALTSYEVDEDNPNLAVVDGVLYSKDMAKLVAFPWAKSSVTASDGSTSTEFVVPSTVTKICASAFGSGSTNTKMTKFTMPSGLTEIGDYAFAYRQGALFDFGDGNVLEKIGYFSFGGCKMGTAKSGTSYDWVLPNSVKKIGGYAFASEQALASFTFGTGVEEFGEFMFNKSYNGKSSVVSTINFPTGEASYVYDSENDLVYNSDRTKLLWFVTNSAKTAVEIADTVTEIADYIFAKATSIKTLSLGSSVTKIGTAAFYGMTALTTMTLPETLTYVGDNAFNGCTKIVTMNIPSKLAYVGDRAFYNLKLAELGTVTINEGTSVGSEAFYNCQKMTGLVYNASSLLTKTFMSCSGLTSVTLNNAITTLPEDVFNGCSSLASFNFPTSLETIEATAFKGTKALVNEVELPSSLKTLEDKALAETSFAKVTIPASVTEMGDSMFESATVSEVVFNNSFETLPQYTFQSSKIANATFPSELKTILPNAFFQAAEFKTLEFPNVTTIYYKAFDQATGLETLKAPNAVNFPFEYGGKSYTTYGPFDDCTSLSTLTLGSSLEEYAISFFYGCSSLDVQVPSNIKYIGSYAFRDSGITNFEMTDEMRFKGYAKSEQDGSILGYQFAGAEKLKSAKLNASVTELYTEMFNGCSSLTTLTLASKLTKINNNALKGTALTALPDLSELTTLGSEAFADMKNLTDVTLPTSDQFTSITKSTFLRDTALSSISIPSNITDIEQCVFQGCTSLTDVYFKGTNFEFNSKAYYNGVFYNSGASTFHFEATKADVSATVQSQFTYAKTGLKKGSTVTLACSDGDISVTIA